MTEILRRMDTSAVRSLATLAEGAAEVFEVRVPPGGGRATGRPLREVALPHHSLIAAVERADEVFVPSADDVIEGGDTVVVIAPTDARKELRRTFGARTGLLG